MDIDKIIFFRNFLFKTFIIGIIFAIVFALVLFAFWDFGVTLSERFFKIDESEFGRQVFTFFMNIRFVLLFLVLAPALALHWMLKGKP